MDVELRPGGGGSDADIGCDKEMRSVLGAGWIPDGQAVVIGHIGVLNGKGVSEFDGGRGINLEGVAAGG